MQPLRAEPSPLVQEVVAATVSRWREQAQEDAAQRADDLALLRALCEHLGSAIEEYDGLASPPDEEGAGAGELEEERGRMELELEAFADMLAKLGQGARTLSPRQRSWASQAAERYDLAWGDPGARNRLVPRGAEVKLLVESMPRPLRPPQPRRKAS